MKALGKRISTFTTMDRAYYLLHYGAEQTAEIIDLERDEQRELMGYFKLPPGPWRFYELPVKLVRGDIRIELEAYVHEKAVRR